MRGLVQDVTKDTARQYDLAILEFMSRNPDAEGVYVTVGPMDTEEEGGLIRVVIPVRTYREHPGERCVYHKFEEKA